MKIECIVEVECLYQRVKIIVGVGGGLLLDHESHHLTITIFFNETKINTYCSRKIEITE